MKIKSLLFVAAISATVFNANAQFGKSLKNVGKSVGNAAANIAGDMAADVAANKVCDNIVGWMDTQNNVSADDSEYTKRLASIVGNYTAVDGLALNYKVYENSEANILACANGCIRVYSGMMDVLTDDEMLAVVAEQIGHIVNKDARDNLMKVAKGNSATNATAAQLDKMLSMSGDKLGTVVNELIQVPYSDKQNEAADKYAVTFLKNNGKDASSLVSALEKFAAMEVNDEQAESDETITLSVANKYVKVNSNNAARAALVESM